MRAEQPRSRHGDTDEDRLEDFDTAQLVDRIQAGDQDAIATLYERYFDRVYAYLRVLVRDSHEAEDLTQEVFVKVIKALPNYQRRKQPFRAWLFTIVRNHAVSHLRKHNRVELGNGKELEQANDREVEDEPALGVLDWISDRDLLLFIERLPAAQRQVLTLRYMLDLKPSEIAEVLGRSLTDVSVLHSRAVRFLRDRLAAVGRGPARRSRRAGMLRGVPKAHVLRRRRYALIA